MNNMTEKTKRFLTALLDVYKDEEKRELHTMPKIELGDDCTEDVTAMLIAMCIVCEKMTGRDEPLIDFTYTLNKLAIQYLFEPEEEDEQ